jgi:molecular chaperone DnaJ
MRDYYEILGVARDADADAVKRAYRKLALQYHPDRNNGDKGSEEKFKEATEAYEVLRDPDKRGAYDRYGHAGVKSGAGAGFGGGFNFADALEIFMRDFGGFGGMEEIFGARGGGRRGRTVRKGPDVRVRLPLTLGDVATGVKRTLKLELHDACSACSGTGAEQGAAPVTCTTCGGAGEVRRVQRSFLGQLVTVSPCPDCGGEGHRIPNPCKACEGRGVEPQQRKVDVQVPAGVSTGDYITLRGQGNAGPRSGPRGDILVVLDVEEDPRFLRDGADLIHDLPITFTQAALGSELDVPLIPEGAARVRIAAGTQSGRLVRLRGKGLPQLQGAGRGDLIVRVVVWTPTELSAEQEELLRKLARIETPAPAHVDADGERGFWSKVREAFTGS